MPVIIWYPASPGPSAKAFDYYGSIEGRAVREAPPDAKGAPYPLIVFSHGFSGCGIQSVFLTEHLAGRGYVVAAPDHEDTFFCSADRGRVNDLYLLGALGMGSPEGRQRYKEIGPLLQNQDWTYRAKAISATMDYLLEENQGTGPLKGMIDPSAIGVAGHSLGGWDAFALGGVEICCDQPGDVAHQDRGAVENGLKGLCFEDVYRGKVTSLRDPRVKAILGLSPSVWAFPNNRGEAAVKIPTMMINGDRMDCKVEDIKDAYDHLPPPRYELILKDVDHLTVSDLFRKMVLARLVFTGYIFNYPEKREIFMNYSGNFFNAYLKNDPAGREYIKEAHYPRVLLRAQEGVGVRSKL